MVKSADPAVKLNPDWELAPFELAVGLVRTLPAGGRELVPDLMVTSTQVPYRWATEADARHDFTRISAGLRAERMLPKFIRADAPASTPPQV